MLKYRLSTDYEVMRHKVVELSKEYFVKNNMQAVVLGLSGGIDSALVAALMAEARVPVIGVSLPLSGNRAEEVDRAWEIGRVFCQYTENINLSNVVDLMTTHCFMNTLFESTDEAGKRVGDLRKGNIAARMRMIYLFDLAKAHDGLVLSTDNLTEYMLGFWTLHGDVGNFGPIQQLWKTEVYGLAEFLVKEYRNKGKHRAAEALQLCIDAIPTDGLGITNSDFDQILPGQDETKTPKERYREIDEVLINYLNGGACDENHPVICRHVASEFKRYDPANLRRDLIV